VKEDYLKEHINLFQEISQLMPEGPTSPAS